MCFCAVCKYSLCELTIFLGNRRRKLLISQVICHHAHCMFVFLVWNFSRKTSFYKVVSRIAKEIGCALSSIVNPLVRRMGHIFCIFCLTWMKDVKIYQETRDPWMCVILWGYKHCGSQWAIIKKHNRQISSSMRAFPNKEISLIMHDYRIMDDN